MEASEVPSSKGCLRFCEIVKNKYSWTVRNKRVKSFHIKRKEQNKYLKVGISPRGSRESIVTEVGINTDSGSRERKILVDESRTDQGRKTNEQQIIRKRQGQLGTLSL